MRRNPAGHHQNETRLSSGTSGLARGSRRRRQRANFPALDAVAADVHCDDLSTLAGFDSTTSVSLNGPVPCSRSALPSVDRRRRLRSAAARAALVAAKAERARGAEGRACRGESAGAGQRAGHRGQKGADPRQPADGRAKTTAVAAAQARLAQAEAAADAAQTRWRRRAGPPTGAQAAALNAQNALVDAQEALQLRQPQLRLASAKARQHADLKKKFFATMPVRASQIHTDAEFDNETVDYASLEASRRNGRRHRRRCGGHRLGHRAGHRLRQSHRRVLRLHPGRYSRGDAASIRTAMARTSRG